MGNAEIRLIYGVACRRQGIGMYIGFVTCIFTLGNSTSELVGNMKLTLASIFFSGRD